MLHSGQSGRLVWAVVVISVVAASGACSRDLSRSSARDLLQANATLANTTVLGFKEGQLAGSDAQTGAYAALVDEDLGTVSVDSSDPSARTYIFSLTPKGKEQSAAWRRNDGFELPVAKKVVGEVTGITKDSDSEANVEFSWHWEPSFPHIAVVPGSILGKAHFRRYDDGWRVEQVMLERMPKEVTPPSGASPTVTADEALAVLRHEVRYTPERYLIPVGIECIPRDSDENFFAGGGQALTSGKSDVVERGKARWKELKRLTDVGLITLHNLGQQPRPNILFPNVTTKCPNATVDVDAAEISVAPAADTKGWIKAPEGWWVDQHTGIEILKIESVESMSGDGTLAAVVFHWRHTGLTDVGRALGLAEDSTRRLLAKYRGKWGVVEHGVSN